MSQLTVILIQYFFLFSLGTSVGWFIELFWRRYFGKARRWINPGFLNGPWLPLYGFGSIVLFLLCKLNLPLWLHILFIFFTLSGLEFLAGLIFINHFRIKLWDYSENWGNIMGLVCPLYSLLWTVLGVFFYFFIYPYLMEIIDYVFQYVQYTFLIGLYGGLFAADLWQSFNLAGRIKNFVNETEEKWSIDFEKLKLELRDRVQEGIVNRTRFFLPFYGELGFSFREQLKRHRLNLRNHGRPLQKLIKKKRSK
ncbi:hypothetical protein EXM22_07200 [Oceanispirochaeta crateris]|uniref:ABC transporter permease n=1 Tax=Oceanispirochaeta crateris TaxID=2518645 RepID=A0A5C1QML2_9SPIO|nr:putative ABC transporter permease [Oceanispirochaeta crateris]QEN07784.1 hypothetical protein EXM22_07200 [Oceanispirochaeta crateris]